MNSLRMLVTSAGRRVELLQCFRNDARGLGIELEVHAGDLQPELSAACATADRTVPLPPSSSPRYVETLLDYCREHGISLLVPTHDAELLPLARAGAEFRAAGVVVNVPSPATVEIARDKLATADALAGLGIPTPRTAPVEDIADLSRWRLPLIFKPRDGSASIGIHRATTLKEATALQWKRRSGYIVQEAAQGPEFTVNCFHDNDGRLRCAVPHRRIEVRAGEVSKGRTEQNEALLAIARRLDGLTGLFGASCFQAIVTDEGPRVFELNARFGGGYPLAHRAGARFTRWLLQLATGAEPDYSPEFRPGVLMLRYDAAVFPES